MPSQFQTIQDPLPSLIILQLEIPVPTTLEILRAASTQGVEVLLNPAPAVELPDEAYVDLAHLIVNETERSYQATALKSLRMRANCQQWQTRFMVVGQRMLSLHSASEGYSTRI